MNHYTPSRQALSSEDLLCLRCLRRLAAGELFWGEEDALGKVSEVYHAAPCGDREWDRAFAATLSFCRRWGVRVLLDTEPPTGWEDLSEDCDWDRTQEYFPTPLDFRWEGTVIHYPSKTLYYHCRYHGNNTADRNAECVVLLHELAHCLADQPPNRVNEVRSEMLGFEWQSAQHLGLDWSRAMERYRVSGRAWTTLSSREQMSAIEGSSSLARTKGLL